MSNKQKKIVIDNSYYKKYLSPQEITIRNRLLRCETKQETVKVWNELFHPELTYGADGKPKLDRPLNMAETRLVQRTLCRIDRVYLAMVLADGGKNEGLAPILNHPWVYSRSREVEREPDDHLDLWGRGHFKSTIVTVMGAVQELLINPTLTILILTYTNKFGNDVLTKIKKSLMHPTLIDLFNDVLYENPERQAPSGGWTRDSIFIKANARGAFASVAFSSVESPKTGHHYQLLIYDDLVVPESVTTKEKRENLLLALDLSSALGSAGGAINRRWFVGTRYHKDDAYEYLISSKQVTARIRPATDNGRLDGHPVYFSVEEWQKWLLKSDYIVACQMLQNPLLSSDALFDNKYLLGYTKLKPMNIFITVDYATSKKNRSDFTSMAVVGMDDKGTKYLLDGIRDKLDLEETWTNLKDLHSKWFQFLDQFGMGQYTVYVAYEKESANRDIEALQMMMKRDDYEFEIVPYSSGRQSKVDKIKKLIIDFKNNVNGKNGGFRVPQYVYRNGKYFEWDISMGKDGAANVMTYKEINGDYFEKIEQDEITSFGDYDNFLKLQHRVAPLKKKDFEGFDYDYTMEFFSEYESFPLGKNDDVLDSIASLYSIPDISDYIGGLKNLNSKNLIKQDIQTYNY